MELKQENLIEIKNLTKDYGDNRGVFDINLSINKGEMVGFVGGLEVDVSRMSFLVEFEAHLFLLDREGTVSHSLGTELGGEGVEG